MSTAHVDDTGFPETVPGLASWDPSPEELEGMARLAFLVPAYINVDTRFLSSFTSLVSRYAAHTGREPRVLVQQGPYAAQNMRAGVKRLLEYPAAEWDRLLVVETDMLLPRNALFMHASLAPSDEIVGSVYFQHAPPFHCNLMTEHPEHHKLAHWVPQGIRWLLENPGLHECHCVGLGCTSISRHVLEEWPAGVPMFRNEWSEEAAQDQFSDGEVSHDVWFCVEARKLGRWIGILSSCVCGHMTAAMTGPPQFFAYHARELTESPSTAGSGILVPRKEGANGLLHLPTRHPGSKRAVRR